MRPKGYLPSYRDLFPAQIVGAAQDAATGAWRHAWAELTLAGIDAYAVTDEGRGGTTAINYALESNNHHTAAGRVVWMRHRDEDGGEIHYEFRDEGPAGGALTVYDEGTSLTTAAVSLNFVGAGVTATVSGGAVTVNVPGGGGSLTVKEVDGVPTLTSVSTIQFDSSTALLVSSGGTGIATVTLQMASVSLPGGVNVGTQSFTGPKTFNSTLNVQVSPTDNSGFSFRAQAFPAPAPPPGSDYVASIWNTTIGANAGGPGGVEFRHTSSADLFTFS